MHDATDPRNPPAQAVWPNPWRTVAGMIAILTVLGTSVVVSSCVVFQGRSGDKIIFPLDPHAEFMDDCAMCHDEIATDDVTASTRRALERACLECHSDRTQDCEYCHEDVDSAGVFPDKERHLSFSHKTHLVRTMGDCSECHPEPHSGSRSAASAASPHGDALADLHPTAIPAHDECFGCHQMQTFYDRLECRNCHESMFHYGLMPYEQFSHGADWVEKEHAMFASDPNAAEVCAQCHEPDFCAKCHFDRPVMRLWERSPEKVARQFIHPGDYLHKHMWDARADAASCVRCHSSRWCKDCHDSQGITEETSFRRPDGFTFHGPGVLVKGSPDYHGDAARRDIVSCAACHTQGASGNCVSCHSVGAFGGNPHPPGFKSRLSRTGAPVCRLCHVR